MSPYSVRHGNGNDKDACVATNMTRDALPTTFDSDTMRKVLNLPQFVALEYKRHDTSLNDNSSFRNTTLWRSDKSEGNHRDVTSGGERAPSGSRVSRDKSSGHQRSARGRESKRTFFRPDTNESSNQRSNRSNDDKVEGEH